MTPIISYGDLMADVLFFERCHVILEICTLYDEDFGDTELERQVSCRGFDGGKCVIQL